MKSNNIDELEKMGIYGFDDGKIYYLFSEHDKEICVKEICINEHPRLKRQLDKIVKEYFQKKQKSRRNNK